MRYLLIVLCIFCAVASAESVGIQTQKDIPPITRETKDSDKKNNHTKAKQEITINLPSSINVNLGGKLDIPTQDNQTATYEKSSKWFDPITGLTFVLVVANILLWWTTKDIANETKKTGEFTRREFLATHGPRLIVRQIAAIEDGGVPVGVRYTVHNGGDNSGTIVEVSGRIWLPHSSANLPAIPPYNNPTLENILIESGGDKSFSYLAPVIEHEELGFRFGFGGARAITNTTSNGGILFLGYVRYVDQTGRKRQTAFLRRFDCKVKRFDPINHPDYEYQD